MLMAMDIQMTLVTEVVIFMVKGMEMGLDLDQVIRVVTTPLPMTMYK